MSLPRQSLVCLTTSGAFGGAETSLLTLVAALRRIEPGWGISVIAPSMGPLIERCRSLGVDAFALPYPPALASLGESAPSRSAAGGADRRRFIGRAVRASLTSPPYILAVSRAFAERSATIIHSNGVKAHIAAALAKPSSSRLVWHLHDYVRARRLTARILRRLGRRADAIVANSDSVLGDAAAVFQGHQKLRRIYNAVDLRVFSPAGPALDLARLSGLPSDAGLVRVGLVATFARWKGHEVFIDAIGKLCADERVRAYVIGGPVYETAGSQWSLAELQQYAAARGVSGALGFTGHIENVPAALRSLDIVVHASTEPEPFGMVIAEGMASGRAVVAARCGGAKELFDDQLNAIGYPAGSAADLADTLRGLIADPARRSALGAAARAAACERFAPERMAAEFREAYLG